MGKNLNVKPIRLVLHFVVVNIDVERVDGLIFYTGFGRNVWLSFDEGLGRRCRRGRRR